MGVTSYDSIILRKDTSEHKQAITSPLGVEVEVYKDWLYVRDDVAWQKGGLFVRPTVMEVQSGHLIYKDVEIEAVRGPQNGIYFVVQSAIGNPEFVMAGCGVYGFRGKEWVGVLPESEQFLRDWLTSTYTDEDIVNDSKAVVTGYHFGEHVRSLLQGGK